MLGYRTVTLAAMATVLAIAGCSDGAPVGHEMHVHTNATSLGQPDHPIAGPQGGTPQFIVECPYSHSGSDDPIVYPGQPGKSHLHEFFGNTDVDAFSTVESLLGSGTTCDQPLDTAAYWAPALMRSGEVLTPVKSTAYYRPGEGVPATSVQPFPVGLVMIAGNPGATGEQPLSIVAWGCGAGIERAMLPPECADGRDLRLMVTFPDCWDGTNVDSNDHHAHIAYSSGGACPTGFPVSIPQLQFSVEYPVSGSTAGLVLASGGLTTGHADFMNGWDQAKLTSEVELCLHREVVCGVASGRATG